ncbi:MAG: hypothetical protein ABJK28_15905 [Algibacter sp.]
MKKIFLFLFMTSSMLSCAQLMQKGLYYTVKRDIGFSSHAFEFKNENRFNYFSFGCTGVGHGKGTYELIGDSLYLNFMQHPKFKDQSEVNFIRKNQDSILSINIKITDIHGEELSGVNAYFANSKIGWSSGFNGEINRNTKRIDSTRTLRIDYVGYESTELIIPPEVGSIEGVIRLTGLYFYRVGDVAKFKVVNKSKRRFKLETYKDHIVTYKKVEKDKVSEKIKLWTNKGYEYYTE